MLGDSWDIHPVGVLRILDSAHETRIGIITRYERGFVIVIVYV